MAEPYTRTFRVRWSEINALGQVDLAGLLRYIIETAWDWSTASGFSAEDSEKHGLAWVIRETEINIFRPLHPNDVFDLTIWLYKWRRVRGTRFFELKQKDEDEIVAQGAQQAVALDSKSMRPIQPPEHIMENFIIENPRVLQQQTFPKFESQPEIAFAFQKVVQWRDLDSLEHVNNAIYASFVEDASIQAFAEAGWSPSKFKSKDLAVVNQRAHIKYQAPAVWGDRLNVSTYLAELKTTGGTWHTDISRESDGETIIQCVLEWSLQNQISGKKQNLPESLLQALK